MSEVVLPVCGGRPLEVPAAISVRGWLPILGRGARVDEFLLHWLQVELRSQLKHPLQQLQWHSVVHHLQIIAKHESEHES